jgi:plasmid stabilization system protein ParE
MPTNNQVRARQFSQALADCYGVAADQARQGTVEDAAHGERAATGDTRFLLNCYRRNESVRAPEMTRPDYRYHTW